MLKDKLDINKELQKHLYEKGFLITSVSSIDTSSYPFYGNWSATKIGSYDFLVYKSTPLYTYAKRDNVFFLIGHAYNPFSMEWEEQRILGKIAENYGTGCYFDAIDELTGIFILGVVTKSGIEFLLDASGMQYGCYGAVKGRLFISSHMRLIGDVCEVETIDYVNRLVNYKWYQYMLGNYLPGDITCYKDIKRIIPNTYVRYRGGEFEVERFYPSRPLKMCNTKEEYEAVIEEASRLMQNTMALIPKKWKRVAISLTGGIDSNTTFAAANGQYDKYTTFSYISLYRETVDADKAKQISSHFAVPYQEYLIPDKNKDIPSFDLFKEILEWNDGGIGRYRDSEARKKITLIREDVCDVEVKSWVSETVRAYAYKYFGRTKFPKNLTPRNYTSLYKIFLLNRRLACETDRYFKEYLDNTCLKAHLFNYDESDFFIWEMEHGGKCGADIGVMRSCFDITIPYNNRKLLDLLLRVQLEDRISDRHHMDMKKNMNKELYDLGIRVVNLNETDRRKKVLNAYYTLNSILPF